MISFTQFLKENSIEIPNFEDCLGKMRHGMPQLTNFDEFAADLSANDISLTVETCNPSDLVPTQKNFNQEKVDKIKEGLSYTRSTPSVIVGFKPIIVSQDGYVIDGHHRWLAAHQLKKHIECKVVGMTAETLFDFLKGKDYVEKKSINEETNQ